MTKKLVILICFISNSFLLLADNWEPFPLNQISYYKITEVTNTQETIFYEEEDLIGSIGIVNFDSCFIQSENLKVYYSKKYNILKKDVCLRTKLDSLKSKSYDLISLIPDYYSNINDTITFKMNYFSNLSNFDLKLPLNMKVNDSFIQESFDSLVKFSVEVKISLISREKVNTFGIDDSVQVFSISRKRLPKANDGTYNIILSKKFGFLTYLPLDLLFTNPLSIKIKKMELASATKNSEHFGESFDFQYRNRNYLEKTGDVKIFKHLWGEIFRLEYAFIRDSVIGVDNSGDFVFIVFNRKILSTNQFEYPNEDKIESYSYLKKDSNIYSGYNAMVAALKRGETFIPSSKLVDKIPNNETQQKEDSLEIIASPLFFKFVEKCGKTDLQIFYNYQATLDREHCQLQSQFFIYKILDNITDLWWAHMQSTNHSEGDHVVGYKNGDCEWGDLTWPPKGVSVKVITDESDIFISPNPATEYIEINVGEIHELLLQNILIFDIFGNEMHPPRPSGTPQEGNLRIDISTLPAGVYFVRIGNEKPLKFVKM